MALAHHSAEQRDRVVDGGQLAVKAVTELDVVFWIQVCIEYRVGVCIEYRVESSIKYRVWVGIELRVGVGIEYRVGG